jgi:phosphatidylglycerol:prolipoprotein diacylglycerol transferase
MLPQLISLGPIHLYSYGLMLALAFYIGASWLWRDARIRGWDENHVATLSLLLLVVSVLGARALFVATHWSDYAQGPLEALKVWRGGLTLYGGILVAIPTGILYCLRVGLPLWRVADAFAAPLALGMALGRVGCFLNGCCYGLPTRLPWGVTFPPSAYSSMQFPGHPLHPSQLYVTVFELGLMGLLVALRDRLRPGQLWWLFVMLDSVIRFLVDYTRYYEPSAYVLPNFALSQALSTGLFAVALLMYALLGRSGAPAGASSGHAAR